MYFSSGLEYIVGNSYLKHYSKPNYFSKNIDDNYELRKYSPDTLEAKAFEIILKEAQRYPKAVCDLTKITKLLLVANLLCFLAFLK